MRKSRDQIIANKNSQSSLNHFPALGSTNNLKLDQKRNLSDKLLIALVESRAILYKG